MTPLPVANEALPSVNLDGKLCRLLLDDYGPDGLRDARLSDLGALVGALPDDQVRALLIERWRKIVDWHEAKWGAVEEERDALTAENARLREELAQSKDAIAALSLLVRSEP